MQDFNLKLIILTSLILTGCAIPPSQTDYANEYLAIAKVTTNNDSPYIQLGSRFELFFNQLKSKGLPERVSSLYADELYFHDTFRQFSNIDDLTPYFQKTANALQHLELTVQDVSKSNNDYYLRWVMDMTFDAAGKTITTRSIGMTHLRLNQEGRVILHQDFWDSTDGFYKHLPYAGYFVRLVQERL